MPFRARTAIFRWSLHTVPYRIHHHQPHSIHSSSSSIPHKFTSLAQTQVYGESVETSDDDGFLSWLERKAGCRISSSLSIGKSSYGRSLFASKAIKTGDCILKVPYRVQITADNLPAKIKSLISEEVANVAKLAVLLLIERKLGQDSQWNPYICRLPWQEELHNTIFWNESELEMIHRSSVYWETINQKSQIERDFLAIRPIFECFSQSFGDITYKDFMYACTLVGSRAWGSTNGLSLIPFADFVNHDGNSEAIVMSDDDKQLSEVISDRDYAPGEQVLIRYGKFSNATLMLDFGFTVPYNIYDQVQIQLDIPKHDPLHKMKLELMQQYFVPSRKNAENLKHSWNIFTINIWISDGAMIIT
ncbi:Ribulose-1,5 bisphosphate carboxylase/oxygenase large subunit N-methyltransferase [Arachis hypogaea]|nr:Ribulose-1,5 bisphosphate carboxylase/oxygenase large subunit N-methyltransferase [Arachis hypogaea]